MLITPHVELPDKLLAAQEDGRLVVFAGAGVSQGSPSNLPSFSRLAEEIAPPGRDQEDDETEDQFLGRLASDGVRIHRLVEDYITSADSDPTQLHRDLLQLFGDPADIRLVTTNFDRHFVNTSGEIYDEEIPIYAGPAVPHGGDFQGIVHLHGLAGRARPRDLVVTDRDFGRAYVKDGWAARFLADVFENYTVLFVGYSHRDQVIRYLARGIVPQDTRFALQPEDEDAEFWKRHGVKLISYPRESDDEEHTELREAVSAWVKLTQLGATEKEQKIQRIVSSGRPLDPVDEDYLRRALRDVSTTRYFIRHTSAPDWLEWIQDQEQFTQLFDPQANVDQVGKQLSHWFARRIVCRNPNLGIEAIVEKGPVMNRALWNSVARGLSQEEDRPRGEELARIIGLLLMHPPQVVPSHVLEMIFAECDPRLDTEAMLLLSESLLEPKIDIRRRPALSQITGSEEADMALYPRLHLQGEEYYLRQNVNELLEQASDLVADRLLPILEAHLRKARRLLGSYGRRNTVTHRRSAIEPHSQDQYSSDVDILINAARDTAESIAAEERNQVNALVSRWSDAVPILRRIAVHLLNKSEYHNADEKVEWAIENDLVFSTVCRHEVYELLRASYPESSDRARERLLEVIEAGPDVSDGREDVDAESLADSARFKLLSWLSDADPDCEQVREALERIQERRDFGEPEHPEFGVWSTGVQTVTAVSPRSAAEIKQMDPHDEEDLEWLLSYEGEGGFGGPSREGLVEEITTVVEESWEWAEDLAESLSESDEWETDLWRGFLAGLQDAALSAENWRRVLAILADAPELPDRNAWALLRAVEDGIKESDAIPDSELSTVEEMCAQYVHGTPRDFNLDPEAAAGNLTTASLNHIAGHAVHLLLLILIRQWREAEKWEDLPELHRDVYEEIATCESPNSQAGLPMLASRLHLLYNLDPEWTEHHLLPLFDWDQYDEEALLVWHGYLTWGRWNETLLEYLLPAYQKCVSNIDVLGDELARRLWGHIAHIAVFSSQDVVREDWLYQILEQADDEGRTAWINAMATALDQLDEDGQRESWNDWLTRYWQDRINGIPVQLTSEEVGAMMSRWIVPLQEVFPDVAERIMDSPPPVTDGYGVLWRRIEDSTIVEDHPEELARLIEYVLEGQEGQYLGSRLVAPIVRELIDQEVEDALLRDICDHLARLGYADAQQLRDQI